MFTLKQSAAWAIDLKLRYKTDIFLAARVKILFYLFLCSMTIALVLYFFVNYLFHYLVSDIGSHILSGSTRGPFGILVGDIPFVFFGLAIFITLCSIATSYLIIKAAILPIDHAFNLQKRFVSGIAHELRTPLSVIRLNNELARRNFSTDADLITLFDDNIADVDRINETLSTLLHYDRLVNAKEIQFEIINISKILDLVTNRLQLTAAQKKINLVRIKNTNINLLGNQTALEQAFFNILENAIAYSHHDSDIIIDSKKHGSNHVSISIKDNGVGIPKIDIPHIFEPFYRSEKTGKLSGIGAGLAVVQEIVRLHQGKIEVKTEERKGTTFTIILPVNTNTAISTFLL